MQSRSEHRLRAFTLTELMIVIAILSILSSAVLFALYGAIEDARAARTRSQIAKLDSLIMRKWESFRTRTIRLDTGGDYDPVFVGAARLVALRDIMRMELPDRISDLESAPVVLPLNGSQQVPPPAAFRSYRRRAQMTINNNQGSSNFNSATRPSGWSELYQDAECLYLIISGMRDGDESALSYFSEGEIGDADDDGMPEIWDAWEQPIAFHRWAPGYSVGPGPDKKWGDGASNDIRQRGVGTCDDELLSEAQLPFPDKSPDPFDPLRLDDDARGTNFPERYTFALKPLIYSFGPDKTRDIIYDFASGNSKIIYATGNPNGTPASPIVDPFYVMPAASGTPQIQVGTPWDVADDGVINSVDNITNHLLDG